MLAAALSVAATKPRGSPSDGLGRDNHVRHHHGLAHLIGEIGSRAAHAALCLVEHQQSVVAISQLAGFPNVIRIERVDAAFALH